MKLHQRIRRDQGTHNDDWLITYADTITLLLCLFVIMLTVRTSGASLARDVAQPVTQMGVALAPVAQASMVQVTVVRVPIVAVAASKDIFGEKSPFQTLTWNTDPAAEQGSDARVETIVPEPVTEAMRHPVTESAHVAAPVEEDMPALVSLPAIVDRLNARGTAAVEQTGDRITTLQFGDAAVFGSGYAALSSTGKSILSDVALTLKSAGYAAYHITVEGHTDDTPINTVQFQSNWELSAARASAVVRFFLEQGIPAGKLTAAGYADTFPIVPNRNADGTVIPENQARNRRVVIRLEKIDKAER
jgi:chemotaxis protein MotB